MEERRSSRLRSMSSRPAAAGGHELNAVSTNPRSGGSHARTTLRPSEVPLGERASGAGFQVTFEAVGFELRRELHGDYQMPRTVTRCVHVLAGVVPVESASDVAADADVVMRGVGLTAKDVDEPSVSCHLKCVSTAQARRLLSSEPPEIRQECSSGRSYCDIG